jgi:DNA (cytosine-5)-methyltransferase 1
MNAVDLFSGAGGFSLAAIQAGYNLEFAVENDNHAVLTYRKNICEKHSLVDTVIYSQNIETFDPKQLSEEHFQGERQCDLLLGGPPCQGFSTHRICDAGVDDPRNKLIHTYFEFVSALKPRMFLMENVPGILWPRHAGYLKQFYKEGTRAGYHLFDPVVIDARDFGIPQRRKRVFVLGLQGGVNAQDFQWPPQPTHCSSKARQTYPQLKTWVACAKAFGPSRKYDINNQHMNHGSELIKAFENTPINGGSRKDSGRILACHKKHDGHKDVYGRIDPMLPAPTMTTACINPSKGRFVHPTEHHGITPRQAARIQTFPDDFEFLGGLIASGKQIGNAVPVELGRILISHITQLITKEDEQLKDQVVQGCA